jgi:16S rRNA (cytosine1402-N4)-methyltransferase
MKNNNYHEPVLVKEIINIINNNCDKNDLKIIDATLGTGGHSIKFLGQGWKVLGIEVDKSMLELAQDRLANNSKISFANGNFKDIDKISRSSGFDNADAILFDLGVSNIQLTSSERGFSFSNPEAKLDMRVDPENQSVKASDLLNVLREDQLREVFEKVIDKHLSKIISEEIIKYRKVRKIETVGDLNKISEVLPGKKGLNKATLVFLALRIAVNSEFENLIEVLPKAFEILNKNGILLVISFHSGEDRIVKEYFKSLSEKGLAKVFDLVVPGIDETNMNIKSRSSKLRYIQKI